MNDELVKCIQIACADVQSQMKYEMYMYGLMMRPRQLGN
jgi:hypothetical protein